MVGLKPFAGPSLRSYRSRIFTLLFSSATAQFIPIAITPVLSRLFTPEDFGALGVYSAVVAVLCVAGSWRMEHSILIEKDDVTARVLETMCLTLCLGMGGSTLLVFLILHAVNIPSEAAGITILLSVLIAIGLAVSAALQVLAVGLLRNNSVYLLARARVLQAIATAAVSLVAGLLFGGGKALILAVLTGQIVGLILIGWHIAADGRLLAPRDWPRAVELLKKYKRFPTFTLPADLLSAASTQLPMFFLAANFGAHAAGAFLLSQRVLLVPLAVVGSAVTDIYKSDASRAYAESGNCLKLTQRTALGLAALSVPPALVLILWSPDIFVFVFGQDWEMAGVLCQLLVAPAFLRFIATSISYNFYLAQRQAEDLLVQGYNIVSSAAIFGAAYLGAFDLHACIRAYAANLALIYLYYLVRALIIARGKSGTKSYSNDGRGS